MPVHRKIEPVAYRGGGNDGEQYCQQGSLKTLPQAAGGRMQQAQQPQQKRQRDGDAGNFDVKQQAFGEQRGGFQIGLAADAAGHKMQEHQGAFGREQNNNACPQDKELADLAAVVSETGHGFRLLLMVKRWGMTYGRFDYAELRFRLPMVLASAHFQAETFTKPLRQPA